MITTFLRSYGLRVRRSTLAVCDIATMRPNDAIRAALAALDDSNVVFLCAMRRSRLVRVYSFWLASSAFRSGSAQAHHCELC